MGGVMTKRRKPDQTPRQGRKTRRKPVQCLRCGYVWVPYGSGLPRSCAACNSPLWNVPRTRRPSRE
jgi:predicted Zn-ribbon and HTH transcriptional regulator